jgi:hypothetical protein
MMAVGAVAAFLLMPPSKIIRDDGTQVAVIKPRGFVEELKANLEIFRDWKLLIMVNCIPDEQRTQADKPRFQLFFRQNVFSYIAAQSMPFTMI